PWGRWPARPRPVAPAQRGAGDRRTSLDRALPRGLDRGVELADEPALGRPLGAHGRDHSRVDDPGAADTDLSAAAAPARRLPGILSGRESRSPGAQAPAAVARRPADLLEDIEAGVGANLDRRGPRCS